MYWTPDLLAIGSSTGGPRALLELFSHIRIILPFPTVIVNHFPKGDFTKSFCRQLKDQHGTDIKEAEHNELLQVGKVYLCPGGFHISLRNSLKGPQIKLDDEPHIDGCKPSVDKFFQSAAQLNLRHLLGLVLTGMGHDGMLGSKALKAKGYSVFTQSEKSCTIYGMPMEVDKAGLSDGSFDLAEMARKICSSPKAKQSKKLDRLEPNVQPLAIAIQVPKVPMVKLEDRSTNLGASRVSPQNLSANIEVRKIDFKLSPTDIQLLQELVTQKTGNIIYNQSNVNSLVDKVKNFAQKHQLGTFHELYQKLKFKASLLEDFISSITVHESLFFRDLYPFRLLKDTLFPEWESGSGLKSIWSSACANGQELYSALFSFDQYVQENPRSRLNTRNVKFYASDISKSCVDFASAGIYSRTMTTRGLSSDMLHRYFDKMPDDSYKVKDAYRNLPVFRSLNLTQSLHAIPPMDCIFCRYTLIYFSDTDQQKVVETLADKLNPNGLLILDPAISLRVNSSKLKSVPYDRFTVFRKIK